MNQVRINLVATNIILIIIGVTIIIILYKKWILLSAEIYDLKYIWNKVVFLFRILLFIYYILSIVFSDHVKKMLFLLFIHISTIFTLIHSEYCDILVAGGTLASLGAAINSPNHLKVCLV